MNNRKVRFGAQAPIGPRSEILDDCIGHVEKLIEAGCRHIIFGIRGDFREAIGLLRKEVIPYFREKEKKKSMHY